MFPALCFVDVTSGVVPESSKQDLKDNLSSEEYNLISNNSSDMQFKFKLVELFEDMKIKLANT